jgi:hypothetical protein
MDEEQAQDAQGYETSPYSPSDAPVSLIDGALF